MSSSTTKLGNFVFPRVSTRQLEEVYGKPENVPPIVVVGGVNDAPLLPQTLESIIVRRFTNTRSREWTRPLFSSEEWADVLDSGKHRGRAILVCARSVDPHEAEQGGEI